MKDYSKHMVPAAVIIGLVAVWEAAVRIKDIPLYVLPAPTDVVRAVFAEAPNLARHGAVTVLEALAGMAIAFLLALVLGILMDMFPLMKRAVYPLLVATQTVPMIVLAPILIIYLGFGMTPKILTVVFMCFFHRGQLHRRHGPAESPVCEPGPLLRGEGLCHIPAGEDSGGDSPPFRRELQAAATYSISGAVVGEWIGAQQGLGYYLIRVRNNYMLDKRASPACAGDRTFKSWRMNGFIRLHQKLAGK